MRQSILLAIAFGGALLCSCTLDVSENGGATTVAGATDSIDNTGGDSTAPYVEAPAQTGDSDPPAADAVRPMDAAAWRVAFNGQVAGSGDYDLFALSDGLLGDAWSVTASLGLTQSSLILVLFDEQNNLIRREVISPGGTLIHQLRAGTGNVTLGVAPATGSAGGAYTVFVERAAGGYPPAPRQQVVWLNFAGGTNVRVHGRSGISFGPFDAGQLGGAYAGASAEMKRIILDEIRADYADFDIVVMSSDEGPRPAGSYAVLHFGGDDTRLLGLADSVDQYNSNLGESAIIYYEAFASFAVMQLTVEEMAQMIANTGSHELGHLLGLFHTRAPEHIMDTTGSAWDLVQDQQFGTASLETSVFPTGSADADALLMQTLGPGGKSQTAKSLSFEKRVQRARIRAIMDEALPAHCGTCLDPDH